MIEVEIRKKQRGLVVPVEQTTRHNDGMQQKSGGMKKSGKLTDAEFKARVRALQETMQEEIAQRVANIGIDERNQQANHQQKHTEQKEETSIPEATRESRPKRYESKKKDTYVLSDKPVVFRAKEYQTPKQVQKKNEQGKKRVKEGSTVKIKLAERDVPEIPLNDSNPAFQHKQREHIFAEDRSAKKMKVVVKTRDSGRRSQNSGKMTRAMIDRIMDDDMGERSRSMASLKRARDKSKGVNQRTEATKVVRDVEIPDMITVGELANRMAVRSAEVVKYLMSIGTMATINQSIDGDTAEVICSEFGHRSKRISEADIENEITNIKDNPEDLTPRAPIVAVMGHVDHGKTTLLDTLRKTRVAQREAGGITQHVAAYQIETEDGRKITFIDTPGHAAFSKIRERGAVITDIIVLVVAADDGIKEQTKEVIQQAKSQNVPLVVAINKIDKPNVNIEKVKSELMAQEVILEDFGGETLSAEISAKQDINLNGLIEAILLQAEILELKANAKRAPVGTILESRIDKGKGVVASVIVQHGTLKQGDIFVAGGVFGKIRTLYNDAGKMIKSATPSMPVQIIGFDKAPETGDVFAVVESEQKAKEIAEYRSRLRKMKLQKCNEKSLTKLFTDDGDGIKELNILVKADVYGSLEAVVTSIEAIEHPEIRIKVVEKGVGIISESDVDFAKATNAVIIGFNVNTSALAKDSAKLHKIKILNNNVIYHIIEEIKSIMGSMLSPIVEEEYIGNADVRKIFNISRLGTIAGCYVTDGVIKKSNSKIKIMRNGKCVYECTIKSMKHEKDEIKESRQSHECGILADGFNDFKEGDQIECYEIVYKARSVA